jgi:hypothetical protein
VRVVLWGSADAIALAGLSAVWNVLMAYSRVVRDGSTVSGVMARTTGEALPAVLFAFVAELGTGAEKGRTTRQRSRGGPAGLMCAGGFPAVAVLIGVATATSVVQVFCYQLAIASVFNLLALVLLFLPAVVVDANRVLANRAETCIPAIAPNEEKYGTPARREWLRAWACG